MFLNRFKLVLSFSAVFASVASSANLVQNGNFEASGSWTITGSAGGVFFGGTQLRGSFEVAFKAPTWLSKSAGIKSIGDLGLFGINVNLLNGDCDDNNVTNTDDYLILSDAFDTSLGDALYDARADLNQDGIVNTDDYLILNDNFDLVGD